MSILTIRSSLSCIILLLSLHLACAQKAKISFNGHAYSMDTNDDNHIIEAEHRLNNLVINLKLPSAIKEGLYNSIQLSTIGIETGKYPIGKDALAIIKPNEDPGDLGTGVIALSWFTSARDRLIIASDMGYMESCSGSITLVTWKDDRISGTFQVVMNGNSIVGSFDDVRVKGLHK